LRTSSEPAIRVEDLAKRYRLGERNVLHGSLRDALSRRVRRSLRRVRGGGRPQRDTIWALDHVTFEVSPGEAVGILGRNGAGKTTLLKILSRITDPTRGQAEVWGRVGSLLEVGTGFHPDLTGRENIFLNGAILGMRRREIVAKFDEIVAFAEVERFIDTPVKRYSSGMYLRLAFSVAAHLEPEILLVDEVLAVGDASFQRKCLGKMSDVAGEGRTVLFVSHNMAAIRSLTERALWLDRGRLVEVGPTSDVVSRYLAATDVPIGSGIVDLTSEEFRREVWKQTARSVSFDSLALIGADGEPTAHVPELTPLRFDIGLRVRKPVRFLEIVLRVKTPDGTRIFSCLSGQRDMELDLGEHVVSCAIPRHPLRPGLYSIELGAIGIDHQDIVPEAMRFEVEAGHHEEKNPRFAAGGDGVVRVEAEWSEIEGLSGFPSGSVALGPSRVG
jgi:lipopolysaccharide transport system ATP-binding protein